jgi:hypothetical protein
MVLNRGSSWLAEESHMWPSLVRSPRRGLCVSGSVRIQPAGSGWLGLRSGPEHIYALISRWLFAYEPERQLLHRVARNPSNCNKSEADLQTEDGKIAQ